jgi:hypothetical protein
MGKLGSAHKILVGKSEEERLLGRHRRRLNDNIRMVIKERGWTRFIWPRIRTSGGLL